MPRAREILSYLISSDLIGFHDYSYLRHFTNSIKELIGIESSLLTIEEDNHQCKLGVFPASIDTSKFIKQATHAKTKQILLDWKKNIKPGMQIILGVDRLDYTKGIDIKLQAYQHLLTNHPEFREKVQLIQLAIPSRTDVYEYASLKEKIERLVGEINGQFGTTDYVPVKYIFNSLGPHELSALYRLADILLVTSKRDGMNLVALEYVVSQDELSTGLVLLSRFTGAISTLSNAIPINPWDYENTSHKIFQGLILNQQERLKKNIPMKNFLRTYTATVWAESFMKELISLNYGSVKTVKIGTNLHELPETMIQKVSDAQDIVIFLDYDGTLSPIVSKPEDATITKEIKAFIANLQNRTNQIYIVSGRDKEFILTQFKDLNVHLAAEHGSHFFNKELEQWQLLGQKTRGKWYRPALEIIEHYKKRVPCSFIEKKELAIAWHFRNSPVPFAEYQAKKLKVELESLMSNFPISVLSGKKVIEIKDVMANKGSFCRWIIDQNQFTKPLYIALGDDTTDEDLFKELTNENSITVKVGKDETYAKYWLSEQSQVIPFLDNLLSHQNEAKH